MITQEDIDGLSMALEEFRNDLSTMTNDEAQAYCTNIMIQTGVLNEDGTPKEQIVNGDFFGW